MGVGLIRTGTKSLSAALEILGYNGIHYDDNRLNDIYIGRQSVPNFRCYDNVDFVTDIPSAYFYKEILEAYPDSKAILTVRDTDEWWHGVCGHHRRNYDAKERRRKRKLMRIHGYRFGFIDLRATIRQTVMGSFEPKEFLYKKRFEEHNRNVIADIPSSRLLVINITTGDGWEKLCPFIGVPVPETNFPSIR